MKKTIKKLMAALLAVVLLCAMAVPAFAAEGASGSITIDKAINGETYTAYKIFDVVSSKVETDDSKTYVYMVANGWANFFEQNDVRGYVTVEKMVSLHGSRARSLIPTCRLLQSSL